MGWLVLVLLLCCVAWRVAMAIRAGRDARQRGLTIQASLGWTLVALADARRYWWGARLDLLTDDEAQAVLRRVPRKYGLACVTHVRCPLCGSEIAAALTVTDSGSLAVRPKATCDRCDFRLDACRHCRHFVPASSSLAVGTLSYGQGSDFTHGRCARYREWQPGLILAPGGMYFLCPRCETAAPERGSLAHLPTDRPRSPSRETRRKTLRPVEPINWPEIGLRNPRPLPAAPLSFWRVLR
jgi:hypothetical protein